MPYDKIAKSSDGYIFSEKEMLIPDGEMPTATCSIIHIDRSLIVIASPLIDKD